MRNLRPVVTEMIITYLLVLFFTQSSTLSIGSTGDKRNVTKRDATGDLFPDWVPFKNKHGDQLGEFVEVTKKKPKKRLALPTNFVLKAQSDQEVDEYIDKGQEEASGDEYFDKKEWTNVVASDNADVKKTVIDKTDPVRIADMDSIVNIITKKEANPALTEQKVDDESEEDERIISLKQADEEQKNKDGASSEAKATNKELSREEGDYDYEEKVPSKENADKSTNARSENEAKKAKILESVDELKERHAEEQRQISEKVKEEEMFKEELERGNLRHPRREYDKYNNKEPAWRKDASDYDEYDEKNVDVRDKYKIISKKSIKTTTKPPEILKDEADINTEIRQEKISLFANPHAYLIKDDDEETDEKNGNESPKPRSNEGMKKFSSRYAEAEPQSGERVRISLVPDEKDSKEGEPTLFFPKKRTSKTHVKSTTKPPDSAESETIQNKNRRTPALDPTAGDSLPSAADSAISSSVVSKSSAADASPSSTDNKEKTQPQNFEFGKGEGKEYHASQEEEHGEDGKKAYEGKHEDTKRAKGYHDKEDHIGKYDDHGGIDEEHHDESGHYGHHHHEEHGKKHAKYEESGKHSKGHSTKGSHDIHKKEEYEKNVEFFEEEGDSDEEEKHGGHHDEKSHAEGGHYKKEELEAGHKGHYKGDKGHHSKGGFGHFDKGHKTSEGHDGHSRHARQKHVNDGKDAGKKWIYHHGSPAKTANLAIIDRRVDPYRIGPKFYG